MSDMVRFVVDGTPVPQGSKSVSRSGHMYEANKALGPWRRTVSAAASQHRQNPLMTGPLRVSLIFYMPIPKRLPKERRGMPCTKPDLDKLARAVGDALTGIIWGDDGQVCYLEATKVYSDRPRVEVLVSTMEGA